MKERIAVLLGDGAGIGPEQLDLSVDLWKMGIVSAILFAPFNYGEFDGIVTMYHDQGQIALKLLGFEEGVSIQGGLPCPITTPSHGSAFEIAGTGTCSIKAFKTALLDAVAMGKNTKE